jgi:hypothetical protein
MGRPATKYWEWDMITIPYNPGEWKSSTDAKNFLYSNTTSDSHYKICVSTAYPQPRKRGSWKVVTHYHYYIKNPTLASVFKLKFARS